MGKSPKGFILYKIYYKETVVYLGRTKQPLQNRIRGHLFKKPMHRSININLVSKIEYAEFKTEADMNLYEIYYINLLKPALNVDDKCFDSMTVILPDVTFKLYECHLWDKWLVDINEKRTEQQRKNDLRQELNQDIRVLRKNWKSDGMTEDEYYDKRDDIQLQLSRL